MLLLTGCYRPGSDQIVPDSGTSPGPGATDAGITDLDAGPIWLQCTSDPVDGGEVYRLSVLQSVGDLDGGVQIIDGGFRLLVGAERWHLPPGEPKAPQTRVDARGTGFGTSVQLNGLDVAFANGNLWADLTYIPNYLMGEAQVNGGPIANVVCWSPQGWNWSEQFSYEPDAGSCEVTLPSGETWTGTNFTWVQFVRETGYGECARLSEELGEGDPTHPVLSGWDLRGADLSYAGLHQADLVDAQLQGANLSSLQFGNASITGTIDRFTQLPPSCTVVGDQASCSQ
jgi:hypothetical protein